MDTLMFGGGGLFFILLGLFLIKKHRDFVSHCIKVDGRVIDIVTKVTNRYRFQAPIVQYKYNKNYKFQAEVDAGSHNLTHGSMVKVLINPRQPKTAKLGIGAKESAIVFYLMIGLGVFSLMIGVMLFNPNEFNVDFLYDPLTLAIVAISVIFLYLKLWPMLTILPNTPIYSENAVEVENQDNA